MRRNLVEVMIGTEEVVGTSETSNSLRYLLSSFQEEMLKRRPADIKEDEWKTLVTDAMEDLGHRVGSALEEVEAALAGKEYGKVQENLFRKIIIEEFNRSHLVHDIAMSMVGEKGPDLEIMSPNEIDDFIDQKMAIAGVDEDDHEGIEDDVFDQLVMLGSIPSYYSEWHKSAKEQGEEAEEIEEEGWNPHW